MSQRSSDSAILSSQPSDALHAVFERFDVAAAQLSLDGKWLSVNQKFCELSGYSSSEINRTQFFLENFSDDRDVQRLILHEIALHLNGKTSAS